MTAQPETAPPKPSYAERRAAMDKYFVPENEVVKEREEIVSPSGKYTLVISYFNTGKGHWAYSRGQVFAGSGPESMVRSDNLIADVKRNYSSFPFAWAEGHPDGHDYLIAGQDYQGQTVIRLDTGERVDTDPDEAMRAGFGFCWASIKPSPDKKTLAVAGCYWACPYEVVLFDFTEPMKLPHPQLGRFEDYFDELKGWREDGTISLTKLKSIRKSDGADYDKLPEAEQDKCLDTDDYDELEVPFVWNPVTPGP